MEYSVLSMLRSIRVYFGLCFALCLTVVVGGNPIPEPNEIPAYLLDRDYRPEIEAVRVDERPKIDGHLDEEVWKTAPVAGPILQYRPSPGVHMYQQTQFRVAYDDNFLYFAIWCWDEEPDKIVARFMRRDDSVSDDDAITISLDTFDDKRNGYWFRFNPNGLRQDAIITNNVNINIQWDGIWEVKTRITEYGWNAELALPLTTFSFDPASSVWGLNIARSIKRKEQRGIWSSPRRSIRSYYVSESGKLKGLSGLKQGLGLEFNPYILGTHSEDKDLDTSDFDFEWGGDFRYRISPKMSATLSYNTDFAAVETDAREVNLTRFSLFFPEKRRFFLEDAGVFNFGGLAGRIRRRTRTSPAILPYFSRRIGLSRSGEMVPLVGAAKLSGRVGDYNIGVINALVDSTDELGNQNAFVGRVSKQIWDQSSIGVLATHGDPNSDYNNLLFGTDLQYLTTNFMGQYRLELNAFAMATDSDDPDFDSGLAPTVGGSLILPADEFDIEAAIMHVGDDFNPALGFSPRRGVRRYFTSLTYKPYIEFVDWLRQMGYIYEGEYVTDLSNNLQSQKHEITPFLMRYENGAQSSISLERSSDVPTADFEIVDGLVIPVDDYDWTRGQISFATADQRMLSYEHEFSFGDFYDGTRVENTWEITFLPSKHLTTKLNYSKQVVELPQGDFDVKLASLTALINFTPDLSWSNLIQYDNVSGTMGANSRFIWEYRPGAKLFLVLNQSYFDEATGFVLRQMDTTLKLSSIFRF
tara:strand:+ start:1228 stop:3486 length:2259 start_codon:yes stop_codon:yes gene_type:complete